MLGKSDNVLLGLNKVASKHKLVLRRVDEENNIVEMKLEKGTSDDFVKRLEKRGLVEPSVMEHNVDHDDSVPVCDFSPAVSEKKRVSSLGDNLDQEKPPSQASTGQTTVKAKVLLQVGFIPLSNIL